MADVYKRQDEKMLDYSAKKIIFADILINEWKTMCGIVGYVGERDVFKGSFKKANRSRLDSFTGIGDEKALKILSKVRKEFGIPVVTNIPEIPIL